MPGPRNRPGAAGGNAPAATPSGPTFAGTAPSSHAGWSNLRWTVNHAVPGALREVQRVNLATRFSLLRAYRIR